MTATPSIRWAVRDEGAGHPVLLLHGFTGTSDAWDTIGADLVARHRILVPCLPGHGGTTAPPEAMSVEATADALAALLAARDAAPAHVVGYSLGARVALRLAVAHPEVVDRLVLESPSAGPADRGRASRPPGRRRGARRTHRGRRHRALRRRVGAQPVFAGATSPDPDRVARVREMRLGNDPAGLAASLRHAGQGAMEPLFDRLPTIAVPTLVIAGELDAIGRPRAERVAAVIPGARLAVVDGAGHTPHDERPEAFRRLVRAFLEEEPTR